MSTDDSLKDKLQSERSKDSGNTWQDCEFVPADHTGYFRCRTDACRELFPDWDKWAEHALEQHGNSALLECEELYKNVA